MHGGHLKHSIVSHLLVLAESDYAGFQAMRYSGFNKSTVQKFSNIPCVVQLRLHGFSAPEITHLERITDMPGFQELCDLASKIKTSSLPLSKPRPAVDTMPPFDRVSRHDKRLAWLRSVIRVDAENGVLSIQNKMTGFKMPQSSHLKDSYMFDDIKKIAHIWNFDVRGTVFECS